MYGIRPVEEKKVSGPVRRSFLYGRHISPSPTYKNDTELAEKKANYGGVLLREGGTGQSGSTAESALAGNPPYS